MAAVSDACPPKLDTLFADLLALERCTDADYDRATDAIASGAKTEAELMAEWAPMGLEIGTLVKIKNLKSRPELNGCEATVIDFRIANRRYGLQLSGGEGEKIAVKPDNIQEVGGMDAVSVLAGRLGADVAGIVGGFMTCTRCLEPCVPGSKCRVPHPTHLRTELGMMSGPDGMRSSFGCNACEQQYVRVTPWERTPDGKLAPAEPRFEGSQWCFAGVHTTAPVPASDRRRVYAHTEALVASATLQQEIDALPADVQTLTITSGSGFYDESLNAFTLERHLPELRELQLVDVSFAKIVLNSALTPSVQSLRMQNVPDECDLTLELPNLKMVSIHFLGDCDDARCSSTRPRSRDSTRTNSGWANCTLRRMSSSRSTCIGPTRSRSSRCTLPTCAGSDCRRATASTASPFVRPTRHSRRDCLRTSRHRRSR